MSGAKVLVYGVGINDANYVVQPKVNRKLIRCPFYTKWTGMLRRCYSPKALEKNPSYIGCTVCPEWLSFSNFKAWMELQDWQGKELDKDILIPGNKRYSPITCVFVDKLINGFLTDHGLGRGKFMLGVNLCKKTWKYKASCSNPFTGKQECIGHFHEEITAYIAWMQRKHEIACQLADQQTNQSIANALRFRFSPELIGDFQ